MSILERRTRRKETLRQQILDAARDLFIENGYENFSMRKVAEKIDYSPTTIYLHYKDKAELLRSVCDQAFLGLIERIEALAEENLDSLTFLKRGMRAYVDFGLENPNQYRCAFIMPPPALNGAMDFDRSIAGKAFGYLRSSVQACMDEGVLRPGDVELTSQMIWSATHGVTSLLIVHGGFPWVDREKLIESVLDMAIQGVQA